MKGSGMKKLIFRGPLLTASGYGVHARQIFRFLVESGQYDISVISTRWGATPYIQDPSLFETVNRLTAPHSSRSDGSVVLHDQYDISVQVSIPNEFQKLARVNIGVTAGIETDRASPEWILKCNQNVDLVVVPSEHSANTLARVQYQTPSGLIKLQKPVLVCPEGVDTSVFNDRPIFPPDIKRFDFEAPFNFLCVGLGLDRPMGEDRKNISGLLKWFCEKFKGDQGVGLVLKVGLVGTSLMDFETTKRRVAEIKASTGCGEFPRVQLIHGRLSDEEMSILYRHPKVKALVSLTHGEGFGLPMLEAAACGLPVIATGWSGHLDFLQIEGKKKFVDVEYDLAPIPVSSVWKGVMEQGSQWANPRESDAKLKMKKVVLSYDKPKEWATELAKYVQAEFSVERVSEFFRDGLKQFFNGFAPAMSYEQSAADTLKNLKQRIGIPHGSKTLLYTMPMSGGDVFISTLVVAGLKKKFPDHLIYFATDPRYFDIQKGNPDVSKVIPWEEWMADVSLCEQVFDEVYTPNLAIQLRTSNWVHGGKGRRLIEEMLVQCGLKLSDVALVDVESRFKLQEPNFPTPKDYVIFHPGSGKGQWESRNYAHWNTVVKNLKSLLKIPIILVGSQDDMFFEGTQDWRGKTTYNQLGWLVRHAKCVIGIDSIVMHMAGMFGTSVVSIFGGSYPGSTGPLTWHDDVSLVETSDRKGCEKACYKNQCTVDRNDPCINNIDPERIVKAIGDKFEKEFKDERFVYQEFLPKIFGYTTILNAESQGFPYLQSIKSMLGFCEEVVVVDGGSTDDTLFNLRAFVSEYPQVKIIEREWEADEPGMDGMQKAFARAMTSASPDDFLWQQDADEVVHEEDYQKIKDLVKKFPKDVDVIHLPVVELWGSASRVRTDRHSWKWRLSRNSFRVTHGINRDARIIDEKTGKMYAKKGMSDGCEYIDILTGEFLPHKGFYTKELEFLRTKDPAAYGRAMNKIFSDLPSVFHYSWTDLPRKIRNFRDFWDKCWANLYWEEPKPRFPGVETEEQILEKSLELQRQGGEHGPAHTFALERSNPSVMVEWLSKSMGLGSPSENGAIDDRRRVHHDEGQAAPSAKISRVFQGEH